MKTSDAFDASLQSRQPANGRLPDFVIIGAMKCGTSSLRFMLGQHPRLFIPNTELFVFDVDDFQQHPDFFVYADGKWWGHDFDKDRALYLSWYTSFFQNAGGNQLVGECSTTYLASKKAPARMAESIPHAKLIVILRDPASRTYSHYWHLVRTGRVSHRFEEALRSGPVNLIERSLYKQQIERFLRFFPSHNLRFVLFEQFVQDVPTVMHDVCQFLGVSLKSDLNHLTTHRHQALIPRSVTLQLWRNRLLRRMTWRPHLKHIPKMPTFEPSFLSRGVGLLDRFHRKINPLRAVKPPPMIPQTQSFLNDYFSRENAGIERLIGKDIDAYWYKERHER